MNSINRYAKSLLAKPFVILTGNSGTGKSKIATLFAKWLVPEENTVFVPVGADWTDNRNVLGYANMLKEEKHAVDGVDVEAPIFQGTEVVKVLVRADADWNGGANPSAKPWFLILDEMNLSHVERYFSDFLAHLESPGEAIRLHHEEKCLLFLDGPGVGKWVSLPQTIKLPPNLLVVGTVNVDETTYMFSPKVLDRANVIEFKTSWTALEKAQSRTLHDESVLAPGNVPAGLSSAEGFLDIALRARNIKAPPLADPGDPENGQKLENQSAWDEYKKAILEVFEILQRRSQEFGFRVQKEMLAYARVDYHLHVSEGGKGHADYPEGKTPKSPQPWDWHRCFDEQLMQKVLPKMHGDQAKLDPVLAALAAYCLKGGDKAKALEQILKNSGFAKGERDFEKLLEIEAELGNESIKPDERVARFPLSYAKLSRMQEVLQRDQFVSYIH